MMSEIPSQPTAQQLTVASHDTFLLEMLDRLRYIPLVLALTFIILSINQPRLEGWLPVVTFALLGYVATRPALAGPRLASIILVVGLALGIILSLVVQPQGWSLAGLAFVALIAGALLGPLAGLTVSGVAVALVILLGQLRLLEGGSSGLGWDLAMIGAAALTIWTTVTPTYRARTWAWENFDRLVKLTDELRDRQAELLSLHKSLDLAYHRLEQVSRELEEQRRIAERARQAKAQFAAMISHELRTPLNLIIGFSEMMVLSPHAYGGESLPGVYRGDIEAIYRNARHLSNLVDDVLDLSQIEANRLGLEKEWADLAEIVAQAVAMVSAIYQDKGLDLRADVPPLPSLYVDPTRVREVLVNLLVNAARFTDQGGVTIQVEQVGDEVRVSVVDTGIGIAEDALPLLFREFQHSRRATQSERDRGFGLGLVICQRFVELHGGRIWVESKPGSGTTFHFTLPIAADAAPVITEEWFNPRRVSFLGEQPPVIVAFGQHETALRVLQRHLDGYRVVGTTSEAELELLVDQERPHAIVVTRAETSLDAKLPAVARGTIPVISCAVRSIGDLAQELGVSEYLVKPIRAKQLLAALRRLPRRVRRVLIVDDDPEMVRLLTRMLGSGRHPYDVLQAFGGAEALTLIREHRPDAIVLDLLMPDVDGYAVLRELRAHPDLVDLPVLVVTAKGLEEEMTTIDRLDVRRQDGLSVGEAMRCLKATLEALRPPADTGPERSTGPTE